MGSLLHKKSGLLASLAVSLLLSAGCSVFNPAEDASVAIIGGADGPTAIFIASNEAGEEKASPLIIPCDGNEISVGYEAYAGHTGMDFSFSGCYGTPVYAAADGIVLTAEYKDAYGNYLILDHGDGLTTLYAQCDKLLVKEGDGVVQGQQIATIGRSGSATGPHLHFEVRESDEPVDPVSYF